MDKLRCIIVDDEEGAHLVLNHFITEMNLLTLSASFFNAIDAMQYIYKNKVDIVFLDINMPGLSGLEMLESMSNRPNIILTTAYKEYALEGYRFEVVDYLVKPFDFKKFLSAVDKVLRKVLAPANFTMNSFTDKYLMVKVGSDIIKVNFNSLIYMQSHGNYVKFFTQKGTYLSQITTTELEEKLDKSQFIRVHKSYIVALNMITKISGNKVIVNESTILPLGNTYKRELLTHFK